MLEDFSDQKNESHLLPENLPDAVASVAQEVATMNARCQACRKSGPASWLRDGLCPWCWEDLNLALPGWRRVLD